MKKIYITAPAKTIEKDCIDFAVDFFRKNNFEVVLSEHVTGKHNYFSGTDQERIADFQKGLNDNSIDFILCARGGYGAVRIIDQLDFSTFKKKPKPIIGFSDVTVFHSHIHANLNVPTVHATVPLNFKSNSQESLQSLLNVLNGKPNWYEIPAAKYNRNGKANAMVVGGNLSILHALNGSISDIKTNGKILFIEDLSEAIYSIDRMMYSLKRSGKLDNLAGLIIGGMTNIKDTEIPYGKTVEEVIAEIVSPYSYPVCFNFPAGHIDDNRALILGHNASLSVNSSGVVFEQH
ncbi:MAG: LD-carboxypeptidase [Crocinitomicaceae bacterium]|nr:LD-carboxypeptidase [Crocinitomicaceae bacterium]